MEEAPENGKESSHSARANGMNGWMNELINRFCLRMLLKCRYSRLFGKFHLSSKHFLLNICYTKCLNGILSNFLITRKWLHELISGLNPSYDSISYHHHHHHELWKVRSFAFSLTLKVMLVLPPFPPALLHIWCIFIETQYPINYGFP
jgi:hypothetical protein